MQNLPFHHDIITVKPFISLEDAMTRKYGKGAQKEVEKEMKRYNKGTAGSGVARKKVTSRKQAVAIGLSKARKKGAKVPKKSSSRS